MVLWLKRIRIQHLKKSKIWNNEEKIITIPNGGKKKKTKTSVSLSLSLSSLLSLSSILLLLFAFISIVGFSIFSNYLKVDAQLLPIPPLSTDKKDDNNN